MRKRFGVFLLLSFIIGLISITSCKKTSPAPAAPLNYLQADINGILSYAQTVFVVNLNVLWFNIKNPSTLRSDTSSSITPTGAYIAFTYTDDTSTYSHSYKGYCHGFTFSQLNLNLNNYDTTGYVIKIFASNTSTIIPGTYKIWADTFKTAAPSNAGPIFATATGVYTAMTGFKDSTTVGTITISQMDYINKAASGTFSFVNYGKSVNGIIPSINVSNGQFNSLPLQVY